MIWQKPGLQYTITIHVMLTFLQDRRKEKKTALVMHFAVHYDQNLKIGSADFENLSISIHM